ncbi:hypothetical protein E4U46_004768 [Claviceps purpurea]|nr:hypothetical protein E4U46_004768 [Claviceps purpurea]
MNKDSSYTQIHMHRASDADLFEDFCKDKLPSDDIYVAPQHQPVNPEDEDDVVPDQHAAFGIQRATQRLRQSAWKDLGLGALMRRGPGEGGLKGELKGRGGLPRYALSLVCGVRCAAISMFLGPKYTNASYA